MPATKLLYQSAIEKPFSRILVINTHADDLLIALSEKSEQLDLHQHFKPEHAALKKIGLNAVTGLSGLENAYDCILLLPSKNKQQTLGWIAEGMLRLNDGGAMIIACANGHGAKSYETALKTLAGNVVSRSKSKCRIFSATKTSTLSSDQLTEWLDTAKPKKVLSHNLIAQPGLFSWDHADIGSQLLIDHLPNNFSGTGLDLCCGYGLLSEHLLRTSPNISKLHMLEADRLALDCATQNTSPWQQKIQLHWLDATHDALPQKLNWIVCNPPFHTAQQRDVELGKTIVQRACQSLKRGGLLYLVANRKLAYERLMQAELHQCQTVIEANGFKVIKGTR